METENIVNTDLTAAMEAMTETAKKGAPMKAIGFGIGGIAVGVLGAIGLRALQNRLKNHRAKKQEPDPDEIELDEMDFSIDDHDEA